MWYALMTLVILCLAMALRILFMPSRFQYKQISFENFLFLGITYAIIMVGFGLVYVLLELKGLQVITDGGEPAGESFFERLGVSVYLSGITLFSVGFGDVVPVGIGRAVVVAEALIGYTIPAAFVVRTFIDFERK